MGVNTQSLRDLLQWKEPQHYGCQSITNSRVEFLGIGDPVFNMPPVLRFSVNPSKGCDTGPCAKPANRVRERKTLRPLPLLSEADILACFRPESTRNPKAVIAVG
jgi:hypothetical protein